MKYVLALFFLFLNSVNPAFAHGDEDHTHGTVPAVPEQVAPRASAQTEEFELVAVLQGASLIIYLDRFADNEAVSGAQIDVESAGGFKAKASQTSPGVYVMALSQGMFEKAGKYPLSISVVAGEIGDILTATLEISAHPQDEHEHASKAWRWSILAGAALGVIALSLLLSRLFKRKSALASLFRGNRGTKGAGK